MVCAVAIALLIGAPMPAEHRCAPMAVVQVSATVVNPLSREPLYAGLVHQARRLKRETEAFSAHPSPTLLTTPGFQTYARDIRALSDGDQRGHLDLKARGVDRDLKCILKGVSLDLPNKLDGITKAKSDGEMAAALSQMTALLSDNIDVITTPDTADSGLDCVIEFGNS